MCSSKPLHARPRDVCVRVQFNRHIPQAVCPAHASKHSAYNMTLYSVCLFVVVVVCVWVRVCVRESVVRWSCDMSLLLIFCSSKACQFLVWNWFLPVNLTLLFFSFLFFFTAFKVVNENPPVFRPNICKVGLKIQNIAGNFLTVVIVWLKKALRQIKEAVWSKF